MNCFEYLLAGENTILLPYMSAVTQKGGLTYFLWNFSSLDFL